MPDFIKLVLDSTKEYEAPRRFYYWSALASISAVLKDKVWFGMGKQYNEYPNIYVLLYGPSGIRKGPAIALASKIVNRVNNTKVIEGRATIEAIIKELGTAVTKEGYKGVNKEPCAFVVASELSSSIISNPSSMDVMTELFDRLWRDEKSPWKYRLKVGESHTLKNPTITWLAGTNEALFKDFLPEKNIHGGLIGRMFMISENKPNKRNSLMFDPEVFPNLDKLAEALMPVSKLAGPFEMSKDVRNQVDDFYLDFMENKAPLINDETGWVSRVLDFIIKVAMLTSSGRRADMKILEEDIEEAMEQVLPLILQTRKVSKALKKDDRSEITKRGKILTYITSQPGFKCTRRELLKNLYPEIHGEDLDKTMELLFEAGVARSEGGGGNLTYSLKMENEKVREWVEEFKK